MKQLDEEVCILITAEDRIPMLRKQAEQIKTELITLGNICWILYVNEDNLKNNA